MTETIQAKHGQAVEHLERLARLAEADLAQATSEELRSSKQAELAALTLASAALKAEQVPAPEQVEVEPAKAAPVEEEAPKPKPEYKVLSPRNPDGKGNRAQVAYYPPQLRGARVSIWIDFDILEALMRPHQGGGFEYGPELVDELVLEVLEEWAKKHPPDETELERIPLNFF